MKYKVINTDDIRMEIKNGLVYAKFKRGKIDQATAEGIVDLRLSFMEDQVLPAIIDLSAVKEVSREAREALSSPKAGKNIAAIAVIVRNPITRTIANFFLKFQQPGYPFRLFTDMRQAEDWLSKYY